MSEKVRNLTEATSLGTGSLFYAVDPNRAVGDTDVKIDKDNMSDIIGAASGGEVVSKTGTTIEFTEDALYNEISFLTSGNLTLDLTGAVKNTIAQVYCNGYEPTITGADFFIASGLIDPTSLNILSFYYDGTRIYLNIANVDSLTAPQITSIAQGDTELTINWGSVPDADNYVLERSLDDFATVGTEVYSGALLSYTDTGLTNATQYYYRVKAQGSGFIESTYSTSSSETPSSFSWATRTPSYGISIREKLDASATYAFTVVPNIDGTGTETQIGFDGELVDFQQIIDIADNDLYIKSFKAQGSFAGIDIPRISGDCIQIKSGGSLITEPNSGIVSGLCSNGRYNIGGVNLPFMASTNPLTAISVTAATTSGTLYYTGSGTGRAFELEHNLSSLEMATVQDAFLVNQNAIDASSDMRILQLRKTSTELFGYNDNNLGSQNLSYTDNSSANNQINFFTANGGLRPFGGYVGSVLFYNTDIGETELFKIRDYFNSVYSIY